MQAIYLSLFSTELNNSLVLWDGACIQNCALIRYVLTSSRNNCRFCIRQTRTPSLRSCSPLVGCNDAYVRSGQDFFAGFDAVVHNLSPLEDQLINACRIYKYLVIYVYVRSPCLETRQGSNSSTFSRPWFLLLFSAIAELLPHLQGGARLLRRYFPSLPRQHVPSRTAALCSFPQPPSCRLS